MGIMHQVYHLFYIQRDLLPAVRVRGGGPGGAPPPPPLQPSTGTPTGFS